MIFRRARNMRLLGAIGLLIACGIVANAATAAVGDYTVGTATSDAQTTVVVTVPVSYTRMIVAPRLHCELRSDTQFGNPGGGQYGTWMMELPFDSYSGSGSTTVTARLAVVTKHGQFFPLDPK